VQLTFDLVPHHKADSQDLAQRAATYFSDHGYAGTSMRKVAAYLGLSKSTTFQPRKSCFWPARKK